MYIFGNVSASDTRHKPICSNTDISAFSCHLQTKRCILRHITIKDTVVGSEQPFVMLTAKASAELNTS
jgi:hypothetical protein